MSPGNGCEEFMTDWSVVCADRKLTAQCWKDVSPQINKLYINISSWGPGMCYQWQNISWLHKYSFPPHPSKASTQILELYFLFWTYIRICAKFKVVYVAHQPKAREKRLQRCRRWHEVQTPEGMRCELQNSAVSLVLQPPVQAILFFICKGICNVYRHTCIHAQGFVCLHMHTEGRRETYKLLTAAYSRNSFCLMALLGFLIVMTNWLPSNAEMGKASWSYRRNMRTYLTMCKGTQGLFYFFFFFDFFFFLRGENRKGGLKWKQCKSFGSFFKQESSFVNVVPNKLLGWLLSVQRNFWGILSWPLCKKWQLTVQFPEPQQSTARPLQYLAQMDASEDAHGWRAESISSPQQQCCSLRTSSPSSPSCAGTAPPAVQRPFQITQQPHFGQ